MSLAAKEIKSSKRKAQLGTGTHCVMIYKLYFLVNSDKRPILANGKNKIMVVEFKGANKGIHEQHYPIDGAWRQENFKKMMSTAQVRGKDGQAAKTSDAIGKRLWISIKEVHYMDEGIIINDVNDEPKVEYYIFKLSPYIDGGRKPAIIGDPAENDGTPTGPFVSYNDVSIVDKPIKEPSAKKVETKSNSKMVVNNAEENFLNENKNNGEEEPQF